MLFDPRPNYHGNCDSAPKVAHLLRLLDLHRAFFLRFLFSFGYFPFSVRVKSSSCFLVSLIYETSSLLQPKVKLYIDGKFVDSQTSEWIDLRNPVRTTRFNFC
jgi:hypothetical protein